MPRRAAFSPFMRSMAYHAPRSSSPHEKPTRLHSTHHSSSLWSLSSSATIRFWLFVAVVTFLFFQPPAPFLASPPPANAQHVQQRASIIPQVSRSAKPSSDSSVSSGPHPQPKPPVINSVANANNNNNNPPGQLRQSPTNTSNSFRDAIVKPVSAGAAAAPNNSTHSNPPVDIAFFIQVSDSTVQHLPRLLRVLHHPSNVYAIHFDLKIPANARANAERNIRSVQAYASNVHIMPSELITYRGVSMLLNTINAMRLLLELHSKWNYFINLSGADYPLLNAVTTRKLLGHTHGLNYFTFAPKRTWPTMAENRLSELWYDESLAFRTKASLGRLTNLQIRNPLVDNKQFEVTHAEAWMINSREFCEFVVRGDMARKMLVAFAYAVDSSEHYFATLAWNHEKFKKSIVPHSLRMIIWMHKGVLSGQHPYYIDDLQGEGQFKFKQLVSESVLFFARKFKNPNSKMMDYIDERANNPTVISEATTHIHNKISSRALRIMEL